MMVLRAIRLWILAAALSAAGSLGPPSPAAAQSDQPPLPSAGETAMRVLSTPEAQDAGTAALTLLPNGERVAAGYEFVVALAESGQERKDASRNALLLASAANAGLLKGLVAHGQGNSIRAEEIKGNLYFISESLASKHRYYGADLLAAVGENFGYAFTSAGVQLAASWAVDKFVKIDLINQLFGGSWVVENRAAKLLGELLRPGERFKAAYEFLERTSDPPVEGSRQRPWRAPLQLNVDSMTATLDPPAPAFPPAWPLQPAAAAPARAWVPQAAAAAPAPAWVPQAAAAAPAPAWVPPSAGRPSVPGYTMVDAATRENHPERSIPSADRGGSSYDPPVSSEPRTVQGSQVDARDAERAQEWACAGAGADKPGCGKYNSTTTDAPVDRNQSWDGRRGEPSVVPPRE